MTKYNIEQIVNVLRRRDVQHFLKVRELNIYGIHPMPPTNLDQNLIAELNWALEGNDITNQNPCPTLIKDPEHFPGTVHCLRKRRTFTDIICRRRIKSLWPETDESWKSLFDILSKSPIVRRGKEFILDK